MSGKKIGLFLLLGFLVFFVIKSPADAAAVTKNIQHLIGQIYDGMVKFVDSFRS